ncbi:hypothetical protein [Acidiphilium sp. PM]|uniref:hypothetical protein n=1 Tax=Acidiphilium sp. PM TaxID=1043206 RepID=UPI0002145152|nr:hypothetical protein [Acidiphilium sp. PM]EGO94281.1 hypothetical protein APM_2930 [Acidiphilium sp. PM]
MTNLIKPPNSIFRRPDRRKIFDPNPDASPAPVVDDKIEIPRQIDVAVRLLNDAANTKDYQIKFDQKIQDLFFEVLSYHPRAAEKTGPGVSYFFRAPNPYTGWNVIKFRRVDLTEDDLDTRLAVGAMVNPDAGWVRLSAVYKAMRNAVYHQVEDARVIARKAAMAAGQPGMMWCAETLEWIDERNCHVDHDGIPFSIIASSWLIRNKIDTSTLKTESVYPSPGRKFTSGELKESFSDFHKKYAHLKIVGKARHKKRHFTARREIPFATLLEMDDQLPVYLDKIKNGEIKITENIQDTNIIKNNVIILPTHKRLSFKNFSNKENTRITSLSR